MIFTIQHLLVLLAGNPSHAAGKQYQTGFLHWQIKELQGLQNTSHTRTAILNNL